MDELVRKPLSNFDLIKILGDVNIISYRQLMSVENLFNSSKNVIIFYEHESGIGHWVCLFDHGDSIVFFDSYGKKPDEDIDFNSKYLQSMGITYPRLTYLLLESGKNIEYFPFQMQNRGNREATCGRWCIIRLMFKDMSDKEFYNVFKNGNYLKSDELVTILTECL